MTRFPLAKLGAVITLLGMSLFTFVSCQSPLGGGGLGIKGREFLVNEAKFEDVKAFAGMAEKFGEGLSEAMGADGERSKPASAPASEKATGKVLFKGEHKYLYFLYLGIFGLAALCLLVPGGWRSLAVLGPIGAIGIWFFIHRFNAMITADTSGAPGAGEMGGMGSIRFSWDTGAMMAVVGFVLITIDGAMGKPSIAPPPAD